MKPAAILYLPYLPNLSWFANFNRYAAVIEAHENFIKSTCRNRCEIAGANGRQTLSIPLVGGRDHKRLYKDVRISYQTDWQHHHWQSIRSAYGSAPFYEHYESKLLPFYQKRYEFLFEHNMLLLELALQLLRSKNNIQKPIETTTEYEKAPEGIIDLRDAKDLIPSTEPHYYQVFEQKNGFMPNLSIIDLLMNEGPGASGYIVP